MKERRTDKSNQNIGALFSNKSKRTDKAPDFTGTIVLDVPTIRHLWDCIEAEEEPRLNLAAWKNTSKTSKQRYLTLKAQIAFQDNSSNSDEEEDPFDL